MKKSFIPKKRPELAKLLYPTHGFKFGPYNPVFTGLRHRSGVSQRIYLVTRASKTKNISLFS
jgi:hypothetical protein